MSTTTKPQYKYKARRPGQKQPEPGQFKKLDGRGRMDPAFWIGQRYFRPFEGHPGAEKVILASPSQLIVGEVVIDLIGMTPTDFGSVQVTPEGGTLYVLRNGHGSLPCEVNYDIDVAPAQGYTRTNVSLPRELKARMDAVQRPVNWSAVAAEAFGAKLLELESRKEVHKMDEVIARLKAAEELEANQEYQAGLEAGRAWAKAKATPRQLRRLAKYIEQFEATEPDLWWDVEDKRWVGAPLSPTDRVAVEVWPDRKDDPTTPAEFWAQSLGDDAERVKDPDFLRGFGEGAVEVWEEVKDKLQSPVMDGGPAGLPGEGYPRKTNLRG